MDTFYSKQMEKFYILDCIAWNNQHLTQCEVQLIYLFIMTEILVYTVESLEFVVAQFFRGIHE